MIHVRHAAAAIAAGLCETVLITHGESGRSGVGRTRNVVAPTSLAGQFEQPYGPMGPPALFTVPVLRYMKTYGLTHAQLAIYGLEDLGFVPRGEAGAFIAGHNTAPGGKLPLNTNGGGLSYMHSGMYGMYALQESVRQMRGTAPAQIPDAKISVCHGVGGMFAASGTIIMSNEPP